MAVVIIFALVWMLAAWGLYLCIKNPAIVDLAWTLCVGGISLIYYVQSEKSITAFLVLILMCIWTLRLGALLIYRLAKYKNDKRYDTLTASWKENLPIKYLIFFLFQALGAIMITIPLAFSMHNPNMMNWLTILALIVTCLSLLALIAADYQLQTFIAKSENTGKVCSVGLWRYSRHPNYFFEWLFWIGQCFFALYAPLSLLALISPIGLLYLLLYVTGIPPAEKQSLKSKPEAYREYQRTTSMFIPWPPKR